MKVLVAGPFRLRLTQRNKGYIITILSMVIGFGLLAVGGLHRHDEQTVITLMGLMMCLGVFYASLDPDSPDYGTNRNVDGD